MDGNPQGPRAHTCSAAQSAPHQILVCTACKHKGRDCAPGFALLKRLRAAISASGLGDAFEVSGTASLPGCGPALGQPCLVGWRATARATWLFGDIDPDQPLDALGAYAHALAACNDTWTGESNLPSSLSDISLTRVPAAVIVTREGAIQ